MSERRQDYRIIPRGRRRRLQNALGALDSACPMYACQQVHGVPELDRMVSGLAWGLTVIASTTEDEIWNVAMAIPWTWSLSDDPPTA